MHALTWQRVDGKLLIFLKCTAWQFLWDRAKEIPQFQIKLGFFPFISSPLALPLIQWYFPSLHAREHDKRGIKDLFFLISSFSPHSEKSWIQFSTPMSWIWIIVRSTIARYLCSFYSHLCAVWRFACLIRFDVRVMVSTLDTRTTRLVYPVKPEYVHRTRGYAINATVILLWQLEKGQNNEKKPIVRTWKSRGFGTIKTIY